MKNTGIVYHSTERTPTVLAELAGLLPPLSGEQLAALVDNTMTIPDIHPMFLPSLEIIPMQLFAYYVALMRGCDIDKPRNLAKSVTVE